MEGGISDMVVKGRSVITTLAMGYEGEEYVHRDSKNSIILYSFFFHRTHLFIPMTDFGS